MKRFAVVLGVLLLGVAIGSARRSFEGRHDPCAGFTVSRMLEDPELARQYFGALHSGDSGAREQLDAMVGQLRAVHGCTPPDENASQEGIAHPPASRLPPGHPPIEGSPAPVFEAQPSATLTI